MTAFELRCLTKENWIDILAQLFSALGKHFSGVTDSNSIHKTKLLLPECRTS